MISLVMDILKTEAMIDKQLHLVAPQPQSVISALLVVVKSSN
ncbi:MAG: hypothetical protein V3U65_14315 [Granulosicoccaceae bacterium]